VTPRGHKKRKLEPEQERKLVAALDRNPLATNHQLAAAVNDTIAPRTVSDYLARADPPFTKKVIQDQEPEGEE
jgi:transposase